MPKQNIGDTYECVVCKERLECMRTYVVEGLDSSRGTPRPLQLRVISWDGLSEVVSASFEGAMTRASRPLYPIIDDHYSSVPTVENMEPSFFGEDYRAYLYLKFSWPQLILDWLLSTIGQVYARRTQRVTDVYRLMASLSERHQFHRARNIVESGPLKCRGRVIKVGYVVVSELSKRHDELYDEFGKVDVEIPTDGRCE